MISINKDWADLIFRGLFALIFLGLGFEHLFSDALIQHLMPEWIPFKRTASLLAGAWLVAWGTLILIGYKIRVAAVALGAFVAVVTVAVHLPGVLHEPATISPENTWMWIVLQRSNLAKNLCLLGMCVHLLHHRVGRFGVDGRS